MHQQKANQVIQNMWYTAERLLYDQLHVDFTVKTQPALSQMGSLRKERDAKLLTRFEQWWEAFQQATDFDQKLQLSIDYENDAKAIFAEYSPRISQLRSEARAIIDPMTEAVEARLIEINKAIQVAIAGQTETVVHEN